MNQEIEKAHEFVKANAQVLAIKRPGDPIPFMSFGPGAVENFIGEPASSKTIVFKLENRTAKNEIVALMPVAASSFGAPDENNFENVVGTTIVLGDGVIATGLNDEGNAANITATNQDANTTLNRIMNYAGKTPFRVVKAAFQSTTVDGASETTNYNNIIRSVWVDTFGKGVENKLELSQFITQDAFNPQYLKLDFLKLNWLAMISAEHALLLQVNAGTALHVTLTVGLQGSLEQYAYKVYREADKALLTSRQM